MGEDAFVTFLKIKLGWRGSLLNVPLMSQLLASFNLIMLLLLMLLLLLSLSLTLLLLLMLLLSSLLLLMLLLAVFVSMPIRDLYY